MATGGTPNIFECAVSLNSMLDRIPRGLVCFHTFCEECLLPIYIYGDNLDKVMQKKNEHSEVLKQLQHRRNYFAGKVGEADKMIKVTEESLSAFKEVEIEYKKNRFDCEELKFRIDTMDEDSFRIKNFPALKQKLDDTVKRLEQNMKLQYGGLSPPYVLCKFWPIKVAIPRFTGKIEHLQSVKLLVTLSLMGGWDYNKQMAPLGEDILAITEDNSSHIIRINQKGDILDNYFPKEAGVHSNNEKIYIVQHKEINVISDDKEHPVKVYKPDIENMQNICILDDQNILISDDNVPGNIFWFNSETNSTEHVLGGLDSPTYINVVYTNDGLRYIVSESDAHCVKVYSETWNLQYTIGTDDTSGYTLNYPRGTAVTEQNTILIADQNNHCVSHFTSDGQFLSHILTGQDIEFPVGLLYAKNVLWVSSLDGRMKCFQLKNYE